MTERREERRSKESQERRELHRRVFEREPVTVTAEKLAERFDRAHNLALELYAVTLALTETPAGVFTARESRELARANDGAGTALALLAPFSALWSIRAERAEHDARAREPEGSEPGWLDGRFVHYKPAESER